MSSPSSRPPIRLPVSTYRLQLHPGFTFADARAVVDYLAALGVTDAYCSPPFAARPGSTHGYDATNHNQINPELGGRAEFDRLAAELAGRDLGLVLDFVPNHMGNDARTNDWWRDVLENGPSSPYAPVFDIDWDPIKPELKNRLLLPILGEPYGDALEGGLLQLAFEDGALVLCYGDQRLPVNPRRARIVYESNVEALTAELGEDDPQLREFLSVLTALRNLPVYTVRDSALVAERHREKEVARERLLRVVAESAPIRRHIERAVALFNGTAGDARSFDGLHDLLEQQPYRLAYWRTASDEINYRRFFDINDLAGLRVEDPTVFDHIHRLLLELVSAGQVTGLRLDHVDGLSDPAGYLERLRSVVYEALGRETGTGDEPPFYVVVEKILSTGEALPPGWAAAGTTGYNFLNDLNGLFVDRRHKRTLLRTFVSQTGQTATLEDLVYDSKRVIIGTAMSSEFQVLASAVNRLSESHRGFRDFTFGSIRRALREVVACFPVYRTYVTERGVSASDRAAVATAIAAAQARNPATEPSIFRFLESVLLPLPADDTHRPSRSELPYAPRLHVAMKCQQYTAPVQAKGVEDTAFYRHNVLLSLNEVGGDPDRFGLSVEAFHAANLHRLAAWPLEMTATSTHDTKRGEDARARLNVLSELPREWRQSVAVWTRLNRRLRSAGPRQPAPDRGDEYHFYQALLAVWPPELIGAPLPVEAPPDVVERLSAYMSKAIREAKVHTSWVNPNADYESAVTRFVERTLTGAGAARFLPAFVPFARRVSRIGAINALAQVVLKVVSPGVPDFYQGTELWDLTLVDPDNRRPVDYAQRRAWLAAMEPSLAHASGGEADGPLASALASWLADWTDGRIKLFLTTTGLRLRRARTMTFRAGAYQPLEVHGLLDEHLVACGRSYGDDRIVAVVPRLTAGLADGSSGLALDPSGWSDTRVRLPDSWRGRRWRDLCTGRMVAPLQAEREDWLLASALLTPCPVALLVAV